MATHIYRSPGNGLPPEYVGYEEGPADNAARMATGRALLAALTDAEAQAAATAKLRDLWDVPCRGADEIPETNPKLARIAAKAGIAVTAWFDRLGL